MNQGFLVVKVKSSLIKFYGRPHNFLIRCGVSVTQMTARGYVPFVVISIMSFSHS
jgi:hypothetical protein